MALVKSLLLLACFAIVVISAAPRKGKNDKRKHERPTLAPGETRSPDDSGSNSHDLDSAGHTHDPLHEKQTGRPPRRPRDARGGDKKDRPTLPPGETLPPHDPNSQDRDHPDHPLGGRPTLPPGETLPPHDGDHHPLGDKPTGVPGFPPRRPPPPPPPPQRGVNGRRP